MKQWYMIIDVTKCHDCNNCFMACKDEHVGNSWPGYTVEQPRHGHRWINIERRERGQYSRNDVAYLPVPCQQCENAPCIIAGGGAVYRREDGIVIIDPEKSKGNQALVGACPYGAIYWNEILEIPQKCTFCAHLLDSESWKPHVPRCVHTCPTGALKALNLEPQEAEKLALEEGLSLYKAELDTKPHVLYKNLYRFMKHFIAGGVLIAGDCFEGAAVELKRGDEVLETQETNFFGDFKFDGLDNGSYTVIITADGRKELIAVQIADNSKNLGYIELWPEGLKLKGEGLYIKGKG